MKALRLIGGTAFTLAALFIGALSFHTHAQGTTNRIARGRYLVMDAGRCNECHGDRLEGAPLDFLKPGLPVVYRSPRIAGLPQLSSSEAITFLETGTLPGSGHARPPMPQYRFNSDDAIAIVAYLKSLK